MENKATLALTGVHLLRLIPPESRAIRKLSRLRFLAFLSRQRSLGSRQHRYPQSACVDLIDQSPIEGQSAREC
jgi:hypothetical protein